MHEKLQTLINQGMSQRQIAAALGIGQTAVRYQLRKYGLQTNHIKVHHTVCVLCNGETDGHKLCGSCRTRIRRIRTKLACIKYLGGKCKHCGYSGHMSAFEFHHTDPSQKEFTIGECANKSWNVIKVELEKCELLCANCHRIHHSNRDADVITFAQNEYSGSLLDF